MSGSGLFVGTGVGFYERLFVVRRFIGNGEVNYLWLYSYGCIFCLCLFACACMCVYVRACMSVLERGRSNLVNLAKIVITFYIYVQIYRLTKLESTFSLNYKVVWCLKILWWHKWIFCMCIASCSSFYTHLSWQHLLTWYYKLAKCYYFQTSEFRITFLLMLELLETFHSASISLSALYRKCQHDGTER